MQLLDEATKDFLDGKLDSARNTCVDLCNGNECNNPECWKLLSAIYLKMDRYYDAETASFEAIRLDQTNIEAYYYFGLALFQQGKHDEAISPFKIVLSSNPKIIDCYIHLSTIYNHKGEADNSIYILKKALTESPENIHIMCLLADALEKANKTEESKKIISALLIQAPSHPVANIVSARLEIRNENYDKAKLLLTPLLEINNIGDINLSNIHYLLGKVFDRTGKFDEAYRSFETANKIAAKRYMNTANKNIIIDRIYRYKGAIKKEICDNWAPLSPNSSTHDPVFLISFPRSGTTLTEQILATHSQIITSDEKPFLHNTIEEFISRNNSGLGFPYTINNMDNKEITYLRNHYLNQAMSIDKYSDAKVFIDKLPLNIIEVGFIIRIFSNPKFILLLRDPRDVCLSCFMQSFIPNHAMANFLSIESTAKFYSSTMGLWKHYKHTFNLKVITVKYEDLISNSELETSKILNFLDLPWEKDILEDSQRNKNTVSTPSYQDIASPIYNRAVNRWRNYKNAFEGINHVLQPYIDEYDY